MRHTYIIYLHEKDNYDLHLFSAVIQSASTHFLIDFEDPGDLFLFLHAVHDNRYPQVIIIDLLDPELVHTVISVIRSRLQLPTLPLVILGEAAAEALENPTKGFTRPEQQEDWEQLALKILTGLQ